jgi:C-terminal processing protease CtpA/Prc
LRDNCGFKEAKILSNNIGYIKFDAFRNPDVCAPTASAAIASLAHCSALIIDLRENHGGYPAMVSYIATFFQQAHSLKRHVHSQD